MNKSLHFIFSLLMASELSSAAAQSEIKFEGFEEFEAYVNPAEIVVKNVCRPAWPSSSLKNSETGTVDLLLLVSTEGIVTRARLVATSDFRELDRATMRGFIGCKFKPVQKDGIVVEAWIPFRYIWKIE